MQAMILAAGLGTRLRPLTNDKPKALVEVGDMSLLEITIRRLIKYGFDDIIINVHHFADQILQLLKMKDNFGIRISISDERGQILETGGGLKKARPFFKNEPFLLCNTDVITNIDFKKIYDTHLSNGGLATLATRQRSTSRYLIFDEEHILHGWANVTTGDVKMSRVKKGHLSLRAFSGIHVLSPKIFDLMTQEGKFSIIEVYLKAAEDQLIFSYEHDEDIWIDVGKKENLDAAQNLAHLVL
ncbi:MAG: NDP-sugar pyrophosphorylase family protein [Saprospiraceae bacterium]|jgi:NDP-sugar pyrophosphorylase family protein